MVDAYKGTCKVEGLRSRITLGAGLTNLMATISSMSLLFLTRTPLACIVSFIHARSKGFLSSLFCPASGYVHGALFFGAAV
jgi:hypothetical protein